MVVGKISRYTTTSVVFILVKKRTHISRNDHSSPEICRL